MPVQQRTPPGIDAFLDPVNPPGLLEAKKKHMDVPREHAGFMPTPRA